MTTKLPAETVKSGGRTESKPTPAQKPVKAPAFDAGAKKKEE